MVKEKDLLMIPPTQAHLHKVEVIPWLLLGWAHSSSLMISIRFLSASLERDGTKLIGRSFTMQQDNDPKHTAKTTKEFIRGKKWKVLDRLGQSPD